MGKATKTGAAKGPSGKAAKKRAAKGAGKPKKSAKAISGKAKRKAPERRQYAALPYRIAPDGRLEVLLATSRETKRWVIPKGWPMKGLKPHKAAAQEAFEETGAVGRPAKDAIGAYVYWKRLKDTFVLCRVKVFPLRVERLEETWSEQDERERRWFPQGEAAARVEEPGLRALVAGFVPAARSKTSKAGKAEPAPDAAAKKKAPKAGKAEPAPDPVAKKKVRKAGEAGPGPDAAKKRIRKAGKIQPAQGPRPKKRPAKGGKAKPARKSGKKRTAKAGAS